MDSILSEIKPYPTDLLRFNTFEGFYDRWISNRGRSRTDQEAYDLTEKEYRTYFGTNQFTSYNAFRMAVARRIR